MNRATYAWTVAAVLVTACGGSTPQSPTAPSAGPPAAAPSTQGPLPTPASAGITISGTIVDTISGAPVDTFTRMVGALPAQVTVSAPGHVTRETWIGSTSPRVDLFPERGFDLGLYRQLLRNDLERGTGPLEASAVLPGAPSFFVETEGATGFARPVVDRFEQLARQLVPQMTGGRFAVTRWETGPARRPLLSGWIMIERREELDACGRALVGAVAGRIWLSDHPACRLDSTFAHELGHAFGFRHVDRPGSMMSIIQNEDSSTESPTDIEAYLMRLAYSRPRGNRDVDSDPPGSQLPATSR